MQLRHAALAGRFGIQRSNIPNDLENTQKVLQSFPGQYDEFCTAVARIGLQSDQSAFREHPGVRADRLLGESRSLSKYGDAIAFKIQTEKKAEVRFLYVIKTALLGFGQNVRF